MVKVAAIVLAAGKGTRMVLPEKKQFLSLAGIPVVGYALKVLAESPVVQDIVLVAGPGEEDFCRTEIVERLRIKKVSVVATGGAERQESVFNGLLALSADTGIVAIHDGVRPLLGTRELAAVVSAAAKYGAATLAVPLKETLKMADNSGGGFVAKTLSRENLWLAQTPQAFHYALIVEAHQKALELGYTGTDDAGLVERLGRPVKIIFGAYDNLKITTPEDLKIISLLLKDRLGESAKKNGGF